MSGFRLLEERLVHRGHLWSVVVATFEGPDGTVFERDVVRSPGAVAALPLRHDAQGAPFVTLVRQYRPALDDWVIEIPAGMRDVADEPPEVTARRELVEEVGVRAERLELLGEILPSPGMTDAVTRIYLATGLTDTDRQAQGPEEDQLEVLHLSLREAVELVTSGRIVDAKTVTAILLAQRWAHRG